jgi:hypothetical protein
MSKINEAVANYIAAWNETDPARRKSIVARTWSDNGTYRDAHRDAAGHASISEMIGATQQQFPNYRFRLASGIEAHHNQLRFSWIAGGAPEAPLYFAGTDFAALTEDGRFHAVTGFTDAMPSLS